MNIPFILSELRNHGLRCDKRSSLAGPIIGVWIRFTNDVICSLAPIDDASDRRFIEFLIQEEEREHKARLIR